MIITSKYQSWCNRCGKRQIAIGDRCEWTPAVKGVTCLKCLGSSPPAPLPPRRASAPPRNDTPAERPQVSRPLEPPAIEALNALEGAFIRMAAKTASPDIDRSWSKYEKVKALAFGSRVVPEQRTALKMALIVLITAIFQEESAYVL
jgi:hypothetical protein